MNTFQTGDRVTVLRLGQAYKGQVHEHIGDEIYLVTMRSGSIWRADAMWLRPRSVRNPANF